MDELEQIRKKKLQELMERASQASEAPEAPGKPIQLRDATFQEEVEKHGLILVDFWAPWCGPCRMVTPVLEELARDYRGQLVVGKLNTDENQRTAMRFQVMSIPTLLLFKDGKPVDKMVGAAPRRRIERVIQTHLT